MVFQTGHKQYRKKQDGKRKRNYRNFVKKDEKPSAKYQADFIDRLDYRTEIYGNLSKSYAQILDDLGGVENLSRIELSLAERFVYVEYQIRRLEIKMSENGDDSELFENWIKLNNAINSIAAKLGVARRKKEGSELQEYIQDK